ncbi:hypothetical protein QLX67_06975, partial [Balneolaceae bacterium ANBcel3]|nr:hypothetical protein [Balneolaceae bacterium ANBcel3]
DFSYTTRAERHLEGLVQSLDASLLEDSGEQIEAVYKLIEQKKEKEKQQNEEYIYRELYLELVSRFDGYSGRMKAFLENDEFVHTARLLMEDTDEFSTIFHP